MGLCESSPYGCFLIIELAFQDMETANRLPAVGHGCVIEALRPLFVSRYGQGSGAMGYHRAPPLGAGEQANKLRCCREEESGGSRSDGGRLNWGQACTLYRRFCHKNDHQWSEA